MIDIRGAIVATLFIAGTTCLMPHNEIQVLNIEKNAADYRLPESVKPVRYDVEIKVYMSDQFEFTGNVKIAVNVLEEVSKIVLHSYRLTITKVDLFDENSNIQESSYELADDDTHFLTINTNEPLTGNKYTIDIDFNAPLAEDLYGFYKSSYLTADNEVRWIANTKLQTAYARRVIPCFDEPSFKAVFKFNIITPPGYHTLSNMPLEEDPEEVEDGWRMFKFLPTKEMSTYLMAIVVSDFESLQDEANVYKFSAWARPEAIEHAQYSQTIGPPLVDFYEDYTVIPYAFPKIDQVALPEYVSGATENWGLVVYRETGLLYYDETSTVSNMRSIALVVAHELSHMWFGNLVTCKWWSDTWLNEGFATYFQYLAANEVHPDWRLMEQFVVFEQQGIFAADSEKTAPALSSPCNTPAECQARFTSISYDKGAAILRMVSHILTPTTFQNALKNYLTVHAYSSTVPDDLFQALEEERAKDNTVAHTVNDFLTPWTTQSGFPVINIYREGTNFNLTQERFLVKAEEAEPPQEKWWVPLSWTKESETPQGFDLTQPMDWLLPSDSVKTIEIQSEPSEWVIFNNQESGYYRVNYDTESWKLIIQALHANPQNIHVLNRAQLIDDALNLAKAGKLDYTVAMDVVDYLHNEEDYIPVLSAFNSLSFIDRRLTSEDDHVQFKTYIQSMIANTYDKLGFEVNEDDSHITHLHRANVLSWACRFDKEDCVTNAKDKFNNYMNNNNQVVHANLRSVVYCTALRTGGEEEWNFLWDIYTKSRIAPEQVLILSALGCTENQDLLQRYLEMSIDPTYMKIQNTASVFSAVYSNPQGVDTALNFLINRHQEITDYYGNQNSLGSILTGIAGRLTKETQIADLETFITDNSDILGSVAESGRNAIESAKTDLAWTNTHKDTILMWCKDKLNPPSSTVSSTSTTTTITSTTTDAASTLGHNSITIMICIFVKVVYNFIFRC